MNNLPLTTKIKEYSIQQSTETNCMYNSEYFIPDYFMFAVSHQNNIRVIQGNLNNKINSFFDVFRNSYEREIVYIKAIENLLKQKKYLSLMYELSNNYISEEEFHEELDSNEEDYLIESSDKFDTNKIKNVLSVINKINYNFEDEDLLEIFSIVAPLNLKLLKADIKELENNENSIQQ